MGIWDEVLAVRARSGMAELSCACPVSGGEVLRAPQPPPWVWIMGFGAGLLTHLPRFS